MLQSLVGAICFASIEPVWAELAHHPVILFPVLQMLPIDITLPNVICQHLCLGMQFKVLLLLQFYVLRKLIEHELGEQKVGEDDCYICSLSSRVLVYKGQLTPGQVGNFACTHHPPICKCQ